ncbi:anthranilate synthase component I family protein [Streptomyces sp. WAC05374]|uniref:anthranilate synthase component I family protein n=1 Tax=Streptomyces sp. WAC05374 TaxID=2487420 RepID=UPI000F88B2AD|nr:anthranilate synthase component I family protein [Streptomyces sp. WAC05374]RST18162.1 anthranilate synthase component I family protein [Streptomyces sp. WAC05374]TDF43781.1 anthranilate synthase component I family protein [Streptomyces sp. WAC05374]TDF52051.1 anthranilate synthase component I family protein [Streptomyces sp. WAC05374]TDF54406.1 anthranilate synthase component I family protein [Streptomyces sp. WAC05374]
MRKAERIAVRVTATRLPGHDCLDVYERLRAVHGEEGVFLFESADGAEPDRRWAAVGFGRLAEIRVFAGYAEIDGAPRVVDALVAAATEAGLRDGAAAPEGAAHHLELPGDGDAVWELLARAQGLFDVATDVPDTSYAFGFLTSFAYESVWHMETLPARTKAPNGPDITLTLFRDTVWYDLTTGEVRLLRAESAAFPRRAPGTADAVAVMAGEAARERAGGRPAAVPEAPVPLSVRDSVSRETFLEWAGVCLEHIRVGDIYQIQIGHRIDVTTTLTPVDVYRRLRARNPSPYMYLMPRAGSTLIGASPELFFRIEGDEIVMRPIAGTARRGADEEENQRRVKEMRESTKEQAEHIMLVDLCRNDIGRVSRPSTQPVDRLMAVESYSHVFHLVSTVSGRLEEGVDTWRAVRATFPAGTMTGAPKVRAMEIIDGLERERRGAYAGAVGLADVRGWSEFALCIRTVEYDGTTYSTQSSAGMVAQSEPEAEWRETLAKMGAAHWALTGEELLP